MLSLSSLIQVALGGAVGSVMRYLVGIASGRLFGMAFPYGTMIVNVVGSFLIGMLVIVFAEIGGGRFAPLLMTGFLGGFTTFSSFSLDAISLWEKGQTGAALGYVMASLILSLAAIILAMRLLRGALT